MYKGSKRMWQVVGAVGFLIIFIASMVFAAGGRIQRIESAAKTNTERVKRVEYFQEKRFDKIDKKLEKIDSKFEKLEGLIRKGR